MRRSIITSIFFMGLIISPYIFSQSVELVFGGGLRQKYDLDPIRTTVSQLKKEVEKQNSSLDLSAMEICFKGSGEVAQGSKRLWEYYGPANSLVFNLLYPRPQPLFTPKEDQNIQRLLGEISRIITANTKVQQRQKDVWLSDLNGFGSQIALSKYVVW